MVTLQAARGGGIVEGTYTSWAYKWLWAPSDGFDTYYGQTFYIDDVNEIFYLWWLDNQGAPNWSTRRFGAYNIADHTIIFESPQNANYTSETPYMGAGDYSFHLDSVYHVSISRSHQTYMLLNRVDDETLEVWRNGAKLWSRKPLADTLEATDTSYVASISLTGKYILAYVDTSEKLILYEGT